jgi:hypothetical protein
MGVVAFASDLLLSAHLAGLGKLAIHTGLVPAKRPGWIDGPPRQPGGITNWEGGVTYRPAVVVRPQTIDDVVRVVTDRAGYPSPVRAVGKLHSPAPCSGADGAPCST